MQALHLLALEPIAEFKADKNSYGFRPKRSAADALEACHHALVFKGSSKWILEADIKSCFDKISHDWGSAEQPQKVFVSLKFPIKNIFLVLNSYLVINYMPNLRL